MAEEIGSVAVLSALKEVYDTLIEYEKQTDSMVNADLEVLQGALFKRNEYIDRLEMLKQRVNGIIDLQPKEEQILLRSLVRGSFVSASLDDTQKEIQMLQRNISICQQRIIDKDKVISGQFRNQHIDSRRELEELKQTKKQIGYYNSAVVGRATGQSLNKNL
ncbi:MAG: hypothetical protein IJZ95_02040 [Oscillospiraceae bacterium]|nr:hypothetical protein [Oscillospiraceae bacterium]